jgi:hypothetical protein
VATDIYDLHSDVPHRTLMCLFDRLEPIWRECWERVQGGPCEGSEHERWATAAARLEDALVDLERFAGSVDPGLGNRDWSSRRPMPSHIATAQGQGTHVVPLQASPS